MDIKKFLLSTLAGLVGINVAYMLLSGLIFRGYMERTILQPTGASEGGVLTSLVAVVSMVLIMAYIYPKGYEGGSPVAEGLRFGILLGLFWGIPFGLFFGSMFPIDLGPMLVLVLVSSLEVAAAGLLIGLVYGRMEPAK